MTKVVILSVPYTEPLPMVAPVLLSACLAKAGISAKGIDFIINFFDAFVNKPYWTDLKHFITINKAPDRLPRRAVIDILKFIRRQLKLIKKEHNPEYLGLSLFTNESIDFSYLLIPYIRRYLPKTKIIVGGRGLELTCGIYNVKFYEKFHRYGLADIIVVGDAENAIVEVIENNISGIYYAHKQTKEDLDHIPSPNWDDYDLKIYSKYSDYSITKDENNPDIDPRYMVICSSKGCVRKCTFCDVANFWPDYIYRDGENVARDIISSYKATGIKNFFFSDNLINGSTSHYRKMNSILAQEVPRTINYTGYAIFHNKQYMPESDFELASRAGCRRWNIGVESGSEKVRYEMSKKVSDEDMHHSITNLHKYNITQHWLLMVGYPTETEDDFKLTLELLKRYAHLNQQGAIKLGVTQTFQLLHNSPLIQNNHYISKYGLNYDSTNTSVSRYFWTADINPENTFLVRADRFLRFINTATELNYMFQKETPLDKWVEEIQQLKKIYNDYKPKKMFTISSN
jgi:radical SAM superfamily enzyme YgiQ (UPF0313 family)